MIIYASPLPFLCIEIYPQGKTTALHSRVTPLSIRKNQKDPYYALSHTVPTARTEPIWDGIDPLWGKRFDITLLKIVLLEQKYYEE